MFGHFVGLTLKGLSYVPIVNSIIKTTLPVKNKKNQMTGFYMKCNTGLIWVKTINVTSVAIANQLAITRSYFLLLLVTSNFLRLFIFSSFEQNYQIAT